MIQSAALLFRENGYSGTGFRDVIEHSGAPRGSKRNVWCWPRVARRPASCPRRAKTPTSRKPPPPATSRWAPCATQAACKARSCNRSKAVALPRKNLFWESTEEPLKRELSCPPFCFRVVLKPALNCPAYGQPSFNSTSSPGHAAHPKMLATTPNFFPSKAPPSRPARIPPKATPANQMKLWPAAPGSPLRRWSPPASRALHRRSRCRFRAAIFWK